MGEGRGVFSLIICPLRYVYDVVTVFRNMYTWSTYLCTSKAHFQFDLPTYNWAGQTGRIFEESDFKYIYRNKLRCNIEQIVIFFILKPININWLVTFYVNKIANIQFHKG